MLTTSDAAAGASSSPTVVDLFCGAGGLSQGFRQSGFRVLAGADHDPDAMATYGVNFPEAASLTGNIREDHLHHQVDEIAKDVDVIVGGPPCQAFSQVRNHSRLIDDPRNSLYREFVKVVGAAEPKAFVMENVPGLAQMGIKEQVLADLSHGGKYRVLPQILDAADFGVPQTRKRLFFIGVHSDLEVEPPRMEGSGASVALTLLRDSLTGSAYTLGLRADAVAEELLDRLVDPNDLGVVSAEQAIGDLAILEPGRRDDELAIGQLPRPDSAYQRLMRRGRRARLRNVSVPRVQADTKLRLAAIPAGGNYRDLPSELHARHLSGQKWGPTNGTDLLSRKHYYAYRRLHPSLWAWTLNTKADAVYHYSTARSLSVREFARLQSFPDSFIITTDARPGPITGRIPNGAAHSRYRQVGNAVPPLLAAAVADSLRRVLADNLASALKE